MHMVRYFMRKVGWYLVVLFVALILNFILPRLIPGNPVDALVANMTRGGGNVASLELHGCSLCLWLV